MNAHPQAKKAGVHTAQDVAVIRANVGQMTDVAIAGLLSWKPWKVLAVRQLYGIPAFCKESFWTEERLQTVHERYIIAGETSTAVAADLGCKDVALRRKAIKMGWKRDLKFHKANTGAVSPKNSLKGRFKPGHPGRPKPKADVPAPVAPRPAQGPRNFGNSTFTFRAEAVSAEPLGDRILRALAERSLSAPSLATIIGEKESTVCMQLSAFAHAGRVVVEEGGLRDRRWRAAA